MFEILATIDQSVIYAFFGALGVKLLEVAELHKIPNLERPDLKDWLYWVPFLIMPLLGAGLAQAYISSNNELSPILAINIGVSAPLILRAMAQANPLEDGSITTPTDA